jgi:hypothetical protein
MAGRGGSFGAAREREREREEVLLFSAVHGSSLKKRSDADINMELTSKR